jgi:[ribosomal protein S5]-alanine N-acetyltransferase
MIVVIENIILRPLLRSDAEAIAALANNYNVAKQLRNGFPHPYSLRDAYDFLDRVVDTDPPQLLAIIYCGNFAGSIGIVPGADIHYRTAELGYWLGEPFWGKGIMSAVVQKATVHFMDVFDLVRIFAIPKEDNMASHRVLLKEGYTLEGVMHKHYEKFGQIGDSYLYAYVR